MKTQRVFLGPQEVKLLLSLEEKGQGTFSYNDAKLILRTSNASVRNVLYRLKKKRRITEIEKGKYVLSPAKSGLEGLWIEHPYVVIPNLVENYYVAFWSAMNYWGMTEQIPRTIFITTTKRKKDLEYGNQKFKFVKLHKNKFFGYVQEKIDDKGFYISSKEKTISDCLLHPEYCGGIVEIVKAVWNARDYLNWQKLWEIVDKVGVNSVARRLGYILELLEIQNDIPESFLKWKFVGFRWLDPSAEKRILSYSKWGLKVNLSKEQLLAWRTA
jgi:predicted transcriptional regulator of viral defense system